MMLDENSAYGQQSNLIHTIQRACNNLSMKYAANKTNGFSSIEILKLKQSCYPEKKDGRFD